MWQILVRFNFFLLLVVTLSIFSCSEGRSECKDILEYFWPLEVGTKITYELYGEAKGIYSVEVKSIEPNGKQIIVTTRENANIPSIGTSYGIYKYILNEQKCLINKQMIIPVKRKEIIYLKGPIKKGTAWNVRVFVGHGDSNSDADIQLKKTSMKCKIVDIGSISLFNKKHKSIEVFCDLEDSIKIKYIYSKNIGLAGIKDIFDGKEEWSQKIINIQTNE